MAIIFITTASAVLYLCASVMYIHRIQQKSLRFASAAHVFFFAGLLAQSVAIGIKSTSTSGTLLQGSNILMLASWVLAVVFAFFETASKKPYGYGAFVAPAVVIMMFVGELMGVFDASLELYNRVFLEWPVLVVHLACFFVAFACFVLSAVASGMLLYQQHLAKAKSAKFLTLHLPAISSLKMIARRSMVAALPFFTAGILLGTVRFVVLWGTMNSLGCEGNLSYLSPRMVLSFLVLFAAGFYLVNIYLFPDKFTSKIRSWISITIAVASVVLAILSSVAVM